MGFPVTPSMVLLDKQLDYEIRRRVTAQNQEIRNRKGFQLPLGSGVAVLNESQTLFKRRRVVKSQLYRIQRFNGINYELIGHDGDVIYEPRYRLRPATRGEG
jgi:hypothetical protein